MQRILKYEYKASVYSEMDIYYVPSKILRIWSYSPVTKKNSFEGNLNVYGIWQCNIFLCSLQYVKIKTFYK